eukprot:CAMPEP_0115501876 /NCGR_PEP_ID=MMETSP0271-20121206/68633_1 /TAXON_ID=71861 /ORGANISM="Scrippsiella trochoidea, Strain CCMP3099" /LENGTH=225 /DNA_ID=CAMNT_0002930843 /DNA_START=450 /DNA_END=1127 /DNA_ORIENTATION=-
MASLSSLLSARHACNCATRDLCEAKSAWFISATTSISRCRLCKPSRSDSARCSLSCKAPIWARMAVTLAISWDGTGAFLGLCARGVPSEAGHGMFSFPDLVTCTEAPPKALSTLAGERGLEVMSSCGAARTSKAAPSKGSSSECRGATSGTAFSLGSNGPQARGMPWLNLRAGVEGEQASLTSMLDVNPGSGGGTLSCALLEFGSRGQDTGRTSPSSPPSPRSVT